MSRPRRIAELLGPAGSTLSPLVRDARRRTLLDQALGEILERPLREHVHVASARDGVLVLAAETPAWGHRIRYLAPTILDRLRQHDARLQSARIIVRPLRVLPEQPTGHRRARVSATAASMLRGVAAACDNPGLARALERLARRAR